MAKNFSSLKLEVFVLHFALLLNVSIILFYAQITPKNTDLSHIRNLYYLTALYYLDCKIFSKAPKICPSICFYLSAFHAPFGTDFNRYRNGQLLEKIGTQSPLKLLVVLS